MIRIFVMICLFMGVAVSVNTYASDSNKNIIRSEKENLNMGLVERNKTDGENFLASNKSKPGVITLSDGLQYKVITEGKGPKPTATDTVTVDYQGSFINGKVFDSSYQRGEPASFPVNGVIPGWQEALQLMNTGSTWMIYIPSDLAYGERGAPGAIGPNETLVFKVHLISINSK